MEEPKEFHSTTRANNPDRRYPKKEKIIIIRPSNMFRE